MLTLQGKDLYLSVLERNDCKKIWCDFEYDFEHPCEQLNMGYSDEKASEWFEEIQKDQGKKHVRLGIFLNDGVPIGDIALQDIDQTNRSCSIGMGIAKLENRGKGYGQQAVRLLLQYGFHFFGMERITSSTLEHNIGAQKSLEKTGFLLEGRERKAVYLNGRKYDRLNYAMLKDEYIAGV